MVAVNAGANVAEGRTVTIGMALYFTASAYYIRGATYKLQISLVVVQSDDKTPTLAKISSPINRRQLRTFDRIRVNVKL